MSAARIRPLILNVDDDDVGRYAMSRSLRRFEFDVMDAANGREALRMTEDQQPDLVLLDVRLPDLSGFEVCRQLKTNPRTSSIPVLHVSATSLDNHSRITGLEGGADGYLTEPVDPHVLRATIKSLLRIHEAEQAVRQVAAQWQSTFDAIGDGIAYIDATGSILRVNDAFTRIAGEKRDILLGLQWDRVLPTPGQESAFQRMLREGTRQVLDYALGERWLSVTCDPIHDEHKKLLGGVCIVCDITERRRLEEQVRNTQKLESIGLLAGGVAHDFNNLLTGIIGNASLALDCATEPMLRELLRNVVHAGERAAELTQQLLAYSGKSNFSIRPLDLTDLVRETLPLLHAAIPRNIELDLHLDSQPVLVNADTTQIQQIIMNLVINAAEAIGEQIGTVSVTTSTRRLEEQDGKGDVLPGNLRPGMYASLSVRDTGCGMDAETQSKIFDPFFTTKFLGRGLGLAAAMGIVRGHKGALRVTSTPGEGSTFEVLLPVTAKQPARIARTSRGAASQGETILVVDDEEMVRKMTEAALSASGYRVLLAEDGRQAIELMSQHRGEVALVLLDLTMPKMSGGEALPHMRRESSGAKILVMSGHGELEVQRQVGDLTVDGYLQKPFTAGALSAKVREVMKGKQERAG